MAKTKKKLNVRPLGDRVLVEETQSEERTAGGIVLPDSAKEKPQQGIVVAVGDGNVSDSGERTPLAVAVGDTIVFGKYAGTDIKVEGNDYKIMRESDILAKVL